LGPQIKKKKLIFDLSPTKGHPRALKHLLRIMSHLIYLSSAIFCAVAAVRILRRCFRFCEDQWTPLLYTARTRRNTQGEKMNEVGFSQRILRVMCGVPLVGEVRLM